MCYFVAGQLALTLEEILFFSTGVKCVPPAGLSPQPSIGFLHDAELNGNGDKSKYPKGNTCACRVMLPVTHDTYQAFTEAVIFGIKNSHGFGYA